MKIISTCVLFLMLCFMMSVAQNKKEYVAALLPPLNLVAKKNCVDVNPEFISITILSYRG